MEHPVCTVAHSGQVVACTARRLPSNDSCAFSVRAPGTVALFTLVGVILVPAIALVWPGDGLRVPVAPTLTSPANEARSAAIPAFFGKIAPADDSNQSWSPTLTWQPSVGADSYEYCLYRFVFTTCSDNWISVGQNTSVAIIGLAPQHLYSWQVRARNSAGTIEADDGTWWLFRTWRPPGPFSKLTPSNGATVSLSPVLSWSTSPDPIWPYEYCVDTSNDTVCDTEWLSSGITGSAAGYSVTVGGLNRGTTYYWQVRSVYPPGPVEAEGGIWWTFTTAFVSNGDFSDGLAGWSVFGSPAPTDIVWSIVDGVFQFYRETPSPGSPNQAVVFQNSGAAVGADASVLAQFDLGNSSSVRKRISVLIHDADFSDLSVCTFWLPAGAPLATYQMYSHPTKNWSNATIAFYAASTGSDGGSYRLDNVNLSRLPAATSLTECIDPNAPTSPGGVPGPELLINGSFNADLDGWGLFGQIAHRVENGAFEFYRPAGVPAGVILQSTGVAVAPGEFLTTSFDLGNSSSVRKRVTVLVHDLDFSDLAACTFWIEPGQALSPFAVSMFSTESWSNATLSIYPATIGTEQWIRLDNVSLTRTPAELISGTLCSEPDASGASTVRRSQAGGHALPSPNDPVSPAAEKVDIDRAAPNFRVLSRGVDVLWPDVIDLTGATNASLTFESRLISTDARAQVELTTDGITWETIEDIEPSGEWTVQTIDLSGFVGRVIRIRFSWYGPSSTSDAAVPWLVRQVTFRSGSFP